MEFEDVVGKRKSIRKFKRKNIEKILEDVNLAPSAGNLQAYKKKALIYSSLLAGVYRKSSNFDGILCRFN